MKNKIWNALQRSLFLKLIFLSVLAYLSIFLASFITHEVIFRDKRFFKIPKHMLSHANYIISDLGVPPDTAKASAICDSLRLKLRFEGDGLAWANDPAMPDFRNLNFSRSNYPDSSIRVGFLEDQRGLVIDIRRDPMRYLLIFGSERAEFTHAALVQNIILIIFAALMILILYFSIRWLLTPVRSLHEGVSQLAEGNLQYVIPTDRTDELGQLTNSFNGMAKRIREMIQARDQLLLDVSHELRSPLTRMKVALEFLEDDPHRQSLHDDLLQMETMITEILETERLRSPYGGLNLKSADIISILRSSAAEYEHQPPGIDLSGIPEHYPVSCDEARIRILFKNILSNAFKYSAPSGKPICVSFDETESELRISFRDFGEGIPEKDLSQIFEPFYRVDKSRSKSTGGYGLGLNLSKNIIEAHGGKIVISSRIKEGTTVTLFIPKSIASEHIGI